jgi:hypothetical protein
VTAYDRGVREVLADNGWLAWALAGVLLLVGAALIAGRAASDGYRVPRPTSLAGAYVPMAPAEE